MLTERLPELLLPWFFAHCRQLPWRRDKEPYHVWLSEIMLQQTRVEAVRRYYERFLLQLPTIEALAEADENMLLKLWEGLGYYSRVRNLQKAARQIVEKHGGKFPHRHEDILALSGIGAYTAGAIASICFEQPTPAVDGNVLRVLSRYLAFGEPINDERAKKKMANLLAPIYPEGHCGDFTQALMELGATVCAPNGMPLCEECPLRELCEARKLKKQLSFPVKTEKKPRRHEKRTVFILRCGDKVALCKRPARGLLAGLWQFPDVTGDLSAVEALEQAEAWGVQPRDIEKITHREHVFTHVHWFLTGVYLKCGNETAFTWVTEEDLQKNIGLPTAYRQFWQD